MNETMNNPTAKPAYRPRLAFYHANAKGTGGAVEFELLPAAAELDGAVMMKLANQLTVGDRQGPSPVYPRFDWEHGLLVKLGFDDLCQMIQVFRGECEALGEGKGLYHRSAAGMTKIALRHLLEPMSGYSLEVYRTAKTGEESSAHIIFNSAEATGICETIVGALYLIAFGIPRPQFANRTREAVAAPGKDRDVAA